MGTQKEARGSEFKVADSLFDSFFNFVRSGFFKLDAFGRKEKAEKRYTFHSLPLRILKLIWRIEAMLIHLV